MSNHSHSQAIDCSGPPDGEVARSIEGSPLPMAIVAGPDHALSAVNSALASLLNRPKAELLGRPIAACLTASDRCWTLLDRVYQTGRPESHADQPSLSSPGSALWSYHMWPTGPGRPPEGIIVLLQETAESHQRAQTMNEALVVSAVHQHELRHAADDAVSRLQVEIKERAAVEQALRTAQAQLAEHGLQLEQVVAQRTAELKATNQQLEAFAYSIAHDLRAPLRAMQSYAALLVEEAGGLFSDTLRHYTNRIEKSGQAMNAMLTDLLAFSRLSQEQVELQPVRLAEVIEEMMGELAFESPAAIGAIKAIGPWPIVWAHPATLLQVLTNLTSNAAKFVVSGRSPAIRLRAESRGDTVRVWVEDNGPGIPDGCHAEIFGIFTRLNGEKYAGTGIGLAIVQKGIERMGGKVGVESTFGEGSKFWFELRAA
jgi:signal transduction histidine kinase